MMLAAFWLGIVFLVGIVGILTAIAAILVRTRREQRRVNHLRVRSRS